jgi:heme oxygenase
MSTTVLRPANQLPADAPHRLRTEPFSAVLRWATWGAHDEAESGELEQALVKGRLRREVYADLLAQTWAIYREIEAMAVVVADHPVAGVFVRPEVARTEHIERDLAYYCGPDWRDRIEILPITSEYVARVRTVSTADPTSWIAHGYTRYLAELSGGLEIDKAITSAYGLAADGRWLYTFDFPDGVDPKTWKNAYRQLLNLLEVDIDTKLAVIEEALVAYQFTIAVNDELARLHNPIT